MAKKPVQTKAEGEKPRMVNIQAEEMLRVKYDGVPRCESDIRRMYSLPVTNAKPQEETETRLAMDSAFGDMGGFGTVWESLTQHAADLGQFPVTTFVGYGVLQQIAQNGMIRTCIQTVADDCTREWIELTGGDDTDPAILDSLTEAVDRFKLQRLWTDAIATMGYMGGALIYIDTGTDDPTLPLVLNEKSAELTQGGHLSFVLVDPVNVSPGLYNATDPLKPDYMKDPVYWNILNRRVHHSRLIILRDNLPPTMLRPAYNFLGIPQAQILWDYVLHWNRARVSAADILEKLNLLVYQTNTAELLGSPGGVGQIDSKMLALTRFRDNNSVLLCDKDNEDIKNITLTISGITDVVRQALEFIAAINRTPAVKLLGISPSGFNATGESDIRNYYDHIKSKQELLRDGIQKAIDCIQLNLTGKVDRSVSFDFCRLGADDAASDSMIATSKTQTLTTLMQSNVISAEEARQAVKDDPRMGLAFLSDEMPEPDEGADVQGGEIDDLLAAAGLAPKRQEPVQMAQASQPETVQEPGETEVERA